MGTCECVPIKNCDFPQCDRFEANTSLRITAPEQDAAFKTSLMSFSVLSSSQSKIEKPKYSSQFIQQMSRLQKSRNSRQSIYSKDNTSIYDGSQLEDETQSPNAIIEVFEKLSIKESYDLKKIIQRSDAIVAQLRLTEAYFVVPKTDINSYNDNNFKKIVLKQSRSDQGELCYFNGQIAQNDSFLYLASQGQLFFENGAYYNGHFDMNKFHKTGLYIHSDRDYYHGNWKHNKSHGYGEFSHYEGVLCRGQWKKDVQNGMGQQYWPDGAIFRGYFQLGLKKQGRFSWPNKSYYQGQFRNNMFQGKGIFVWEDNRVYSGQWKDNMMHGKGTFKWPNGQVFKGHYQLDKKEGKGELYLCDGTVVRGEWINGKLQGMSQVHKNGAVFHVLWKEGTQIST